LNIANALRRQLVVGVLLATSGVAAADGGAASKTLTVNGSVSQPTTYSVAALRALPQQEVSVPATDSAASHHKH
jgi:DMSO/TMAO reductase YedYZ molybdopterin-dependent catalytic subunit